MNLWFRLFWYLLRAKWRPALTLPMMSSMLTFRVWPSDLDTSLHMNNGRYLTIMDLGRVDLMLGSGLLRVLLKHGWTPIASSISIRYRRELRTFDRFSLETRLVCWTDVTVIMEQTFRFTGGPRDGQIAARGFVKAGLYDRKAKAFVTVERLLGLLGAGKVESPAIPPDVEAFIKADEGLRAGSGVS
jgi:acyl-CoA thioesterase FadM